ncbi:uncharacterized protein LOC113365394, partial [Ctenocephalides felis]|uniref:uncharacterized protein LOC113365394 n=1 Tax=Ctenocephalides felis TaxID=7515 RepID=UPI000E6E1A7F
MSGDSRQIAAQWLVYRQRKSSVPRKKIRKKIDRDKSCDVMYEMTSSCSYQAALDLKRHHLSTTSSATSQIQNQHSVLTGGSLSDVINGVGGSLSDVISGGLGQIKTEHDCIGGLAQTVTGGDWTRYGLHQSTFEQLKQSVEKAKAALQDRTAGLLSTASAFSDIYNSTRLSADTLCSSDATTAPQTSISTNNVSQQQQTSRHNNLTTRNSDSQHNNDKNTRNGLDKSVLLSSNSLGDHLRSSKCS